MLTKIRSLFLIRSRLVGGMRCGTRRVLVQADSLRSTEHRRNQLVRLYGPSRRPTSAGSHRCTASDCHTGPSARARRARSCGGARAAVVHTPARRWYSSGFYSPVSGAVYSATGAHSVPWLRRRDCEHDRSVVAHCGGRHIARWDHSPILAYACIAVAFHHGSWMLAIRPLGFSDRRRAEKQR